MLEVAGVHALDCSRDVDPNRRGLPSPFTPVASSSTASAPFTITCSSSHRPRYIVRPLHYREQLSDFILHALSGSAFFSMQLLLEAHRSVIPQIRLDLRPATQDLCFEPRACRGVCQFESNACSEFVRHPCGLEFCKTAEYNICRAGDRQMWAQLVSKSLPLLAQDQLFRPRH
jgi:hypothetical protein